MGSTVKKIRAGPPNDQRSQRCASPPRAATLRLPPSGCAEAAVRTPLSAKTPTSCRLKTPPGCVTATLPSPHIPVITGFAFSGILGTLPSRPGPPELPPLRKPLVDGTGAFVRSDLEVVDVDGLAHAGLSALRVDRSHTDQKKVRGLRGVEREAAQGGGCARTDHKDGAEAEKTHEGRAPPWQSRENMHLITLLSELGDRRAIRLVGRLAADCH